MYVEYNRKVIDSYKKTDELLINFQAEGAVLMLALRSKFYKSCQIILRNIE